MCVLNCHLGQSSFTLLENETSQLIKAPKLSNLNLDAANTAVQLNCSFNNEWIHRFVFLF